jgi:hypothetical protein
MNIFSDKAIARRMLDARQNGYTFSHFVRASAKRYTLLLIFDCLFIGYFAYFRMWTVCYMAIAFVAGHYLRDIGWFRGNRKRWPFTVKTTDWQKVESLSRDEPSA